MSGRGLWHELATGRGRAVWVAVAGGLTAGVFALDLLTPLGLDVWLLYLGPILLSLAARRKAWPFAFAALGSVLTVIGLFLSPPGLPFAFALMNRLSGVVLDWVIAVAAVSFLFDEPESEQKGLRQGRLTVSSFVSVGAIVVLLIGMTYRMTVTHQETERLVAHTHEVLTELALALSTLKDAETGQRGFLLTGNETYLEPYERALTETRQHLDRLKALTRDNQVQQSRMPAFEASAEEKLAELAETVAARRTQGPDAARRIVESDRGKALMDALRRTVAEMEQTERDLLVRRSRDGGTLFQSQVLLLTVGELIMAGLLVGTVLLLRRAQAVQEERGRFFTVSQDLLCIAGADGYFKRLNHAWTRVLGYTVEELLAEPFQRFVHPDDREATLQETRKQAAGERVMVFENRYRCKDGSYKWLSWTATSATGEGLIYAAARDITKRKRAEEAQRRLAAIVASSDDAIIGKTLDGIVTSWNAGAERLFGYRADDMVGQPIMALFPPDRLDEEAAIAERLRRGERIEHFETVRLRKNGQPVDVSVTISPVTDERGTVVGASKIARDITERKQAEDKFRRVVESAPTAVVLVNRQGRITLVNTQTEKSFGYSREELIGQPIEILVPARFHDHHHAYRDNFFAKPSMRAMGTGRDLYGLHKDGHEFPVEIGLNPIETEEGLLVLSSIIDITERKRAEEEIRRRGELLEAANKELEAFTYSVSHDLRAPLRTLDGFSQAVLEDYADKLDAQGQDYLRRIRAAAQRMGLLIDDFLKLSRVTRTELQRETVDLTELARDVLTELAAREPDRLVDWTVQEGLSAVGDRRLLRVVLENLLGNAWKFTGRQPSPRIAVEAKETAHNGSVRYVVRDNGAGFDMAHADKLFQSFQRLHGMAEFPGTGIGLAIVERIIRRHGGQVGAEGAVGQGASVWFTLSH